MLIQMPRGSADQPSNVSHEGEAFEAGLRRDLASAPVISYDSVLGGWQKRGLDLALCLLLAPLWVPLLLGAMAWARLRRVAPVFISSDRVGYGNRTFKCYSMRLAPPVAVIAQLRPEADKPPAFDLAAIANNTEAHRAKWRRALERLPQLINVLYGDMSLVGPLPLSEAELEPLKTAKRYYLSARPGMIGVSAIVDASEEEASQYKIYALSWSLASDALVVWDGLRNLKDRGELWRPGFVVHKRREGEPVVVVRKRTGANLDQSAR